MGRREEYALDAKPLGRGGYAEVFRALRRVDGAWVAFKRNLGQFDPEATRRLAREIDALRVLKHENVVQLLDWDAGGEWYTMPLAVGNLESLRPRLSEQGIRRALQQVAHGLAFAHDLGYVHRDVTPRNVLAMSEDGDSSRWVVADWGLVRRPAGQTSAPLTSGPVGTEGFLAPEVWADGGHIADNRADIYGLGRVAAWAITGTWPAPNLELVPQGRWRPFVRSTTAMVPSDRPGTMGDLLALLATTTEDSALVPDDFVSLLERAKSGDRAALLRAVEYALDQAGDREVYAEHICYLDSAQLGALVESAPEKLAVLVRNMAAHLGGDWHGLDFDLANTLLYWMQRAAEVAVSSGRFDLLSDICQSWFPLDVRWDRWKQADRSRNFLRGLRGEAAQTAARVIRATPGAPEYYRGSDSWLSAASEIRAALKK